MRDLLSWNISLGRWAGVQVRLHVFFVLFALVALLFVPTGANQKLFWETVAVLGIFFVSVLLHEIGHGVAAWRSGGLVDQMVLWPLGGLTQVSPSHDPQSEAFTAIAGPAVNFCLCLSMAPLLIAQGCPLIDLFNPLAPPVGADMAQRLPVAFLDRLGKAAMWELNDCTLARTAIPSASGGF